MESLSQKDEWLSQFTYENLCQQIPELSKNDYSLLIHGKSTKDVYHVNGCTGKVSLNTDAAEKRATFGILPVEKMNGIPEIISNTILGEKERSELEQGKYVPLYNDKVAHFNKEKNLIIAEPVTNYCLPKVIGQQKISIQQKCKLLNGEKLAVQHNGQSVIVEQNKGKINFSFSQKGINPEQIDLLETYRTNYQVETEAGKEKLNRAILQTIGKKYFSKEDPNKTGDYLEKKIGLKGDLGDNLKEWFILKNNETKPEIKQGKKAEPKALYDHADNKVAVENKLKQGIKNLNHRIERSLAKGKEFTSTLIQGM